MGSSCSIPPPFRHSVSVAGEQHPHTVDRHSGDLGSPHNDGSPWSAGCDKSRTSGAEGWPGKRARSNPGTAPRSDPYIVGARQRSVVATLVKRKMRLKLLHVLSVGTVMTVLRFDHPRSDFGLPSLLTSSARSRTGRTPVHAERR